MVDTAEVLASIQVLDLILPSPKRGFGLWIVITVYQTSAHAASIPSLFESSDRRLSLSAKQFECPPDMCLVRPNSSNCESNAENAIQLGLRQ
jgi:hypothetical protein